MSPFLFSKSGKKHFAAKILLKFPPGNPVINYDGSGALNLLLALDKIDARQQARGSSRRRFAALSFKVWPCPHPANGGLKACARKTGMLPTPPFGRKCGCRGQFRGFCPGPGKDFSG